MEVYKRYQAWESSAELAAEEGGRAYIRKRLRDTARRLGEPMRVEERRVEKRGSPAERRYRSRRPGGAGVKALAREYNLSPVAVCQIVRCHGPRP
jgi:hypothetical protein